MKAKDKILIPAERPEGPASLKLIKTELGMLHHSKLVELCLQLAKYKKENKELLTYLLFQSDDEQAYILYVKALADEQFRELNTTSIYLAKKTIRKVLRTTNKFIKYSGNKQTEVELLIYYCRKIKDSGIALNKNKALFNLYQRQIQRIHKAMESLHEDLQYDYSLEMKYLQ